MSQKTRNERVELTALVASTADPTPISGTAIMVVTPAGIHAAADAAAQGVNDNGCCLIRRTIISETPKRQTHALL